MLVGGLAGSPDFRFGKASKKGRSDGVIGRNGYCRTQGRMGSKSKDGNRVRVERKKRILYFAIQDPIISERKINRGNRRGKCR